MLNLAGRKFVVIPAGEYRQLKAKAARNGRAPAKRRMSKQDRGDVAESIRRLRADKMIPLDDVARALGFDPQALRR
jgi:hypothetical protein